MAMSFQKDSPLTGIFNFYLGQTVQFKYKELFLDVFYFYSPKYKVLGVVNTIFLPVVTR